MATEITISSIADWVYTNHGVRMYEMAQYFSGSTNFLIIDSYSSSSTPTRYKGDPIADGIWTAGGDVNNENSWFVIECTTTLYPALGLPRWQAKYQWVNAAAFADVSGIDYDMQGDIRVIAVRFARYGGWDLATSNPDFAGPLGQLSGSNKKLGTTGGPPTIIRNLYYEDTGQFMHVVQFKDVGVSETIKTITTVMGDFNAVKSSMAMPRLHINTTASAVTGVIGAHWMCEDQHWSNTGLTTWSDLNLGVGYQDPSNNWVEEAFTTNPYRILVNRFSQPAPNRSPIDTTVKPYQICTYTNKLIGELPGLGKMYGIGQSLLSSREWLSMGASHSLAMKWDPTVNF
jgi:hypothetical protein